MGENQDSSSSSAIARAVASRGCWPRCRQAIIEPWCRERSSCLIQRLPWCPYSTTHKPGLLITILMAHVYIYYLWLGHICRVQKSESEKFKPLESWIFYHAPGIGSEFENSDKIRTRTQAMISRRYWRNTCAVRVSYQALPLGNLGGGSSDVPLSKQLRKSDQFPLSASLMTFFHRKYSSRFFLAIKFIADIFMERWIK